MKKILTLSIFLLFFLCMPICFADGININYDDSDVNVCIISGNDDVSFNSEMTLVIFKNGKSVSDITDNVLQNEGIISCADTTHTDISGNWNFKWEPSESGYYDIYVSCPFFDGPYCLENMFLAADRKHLKQILAEGNKEEIKTAVTDIMKSKALVSDDKIIDAVKNLAKISDIIYSIRDGLDNKNNTINYFELAVYMQLLNENPTSENLDKIVDLCIDLDIDLSNSDIYVDDASDGIKQNLAKRISQYVYSGIDIFDKQFGEQLILAAIESAESWSELDEYLELLNHPKYNNNKNKIAKSVVKNKFTTLNSLVTYIDDIFDDASSSGSGKTGNAVSKGGAKPVNVVNAAGDKNEDTVIKPDENIVTFNDVPESHWAFDFINYIRWKGIILGDDKGNYNPDNNVTRAEYVKMLCSLFNIKEENEHSFEDVGEADWFKGYVAAARKKGLINGDGINFYPNNNISRQDMAVMAYNFAKNAGIEFSVTYNEFLDFNTVSDYANEAISYLAGSKIIGGTPNGNVEPMRNLTRAEAAKIIYCILTELAGD